MDKSIPKTVEVLRDLIKVNYDRMEAYKAAALKLPLNENDLKSVFANMMEDGKKLSAELVTELIAHGEEPGAGVLPAAIGNIYQQWMGINLLLNGMERAEVLDFCKYIEDAMLMVYKNALLQDDITGSATSLLEKQKLKLLDGILYENKTAKRKGTALLLTNL